MGRMIELPRNYCIQITPWFTDQLSSSLGTTRLNQAYQEADGDIPAGVVVDVFIKFAICERGKTPTFSQGNQDATDAFTTARLRDSFDLELRIRDDGVDPLPAPNKGIHDLTGSTIEDRRASLATYKLESGWRENTQWSSLDNKLVHDDEHLQDQDGTEVLLARLRIPATSTPMEYNDTVSFYTDHLLRRFV